VVCDGDGGGGGGNGSGDCGDDEDGDGGNGSGECGDGAGDDSRKATATTAMAKAARGKNSGRPLYLTAGRNETMANDSKEDVHCIVGDDRGGVSHSTCPASVGLLSDGTRKVRSKIPYYG